MSYNKREQLMDKETLNMMIKDSSITDREKYENLFQSIDDVDCVHPFLLYENKRKAQKERCSIYFCFECSNFVELTFEEALIRHVLYNVDKEFAIEQYKKYRGNYGEDITYDDFNVIINQIVLSDDLKKDGKSK